jgi:hypothetical protein
MIPFTDLAAALDQALTELEPDARLLVLPQSGSLLPVANE